MTALPKPKIIFESSSEPITGLGFREPDESDESPHLYLFIVTTSHVLAYQASGRGSGGVPTVVDEIGAGLGCAVTDWKAKNIVIAREEALYVCSTDGRGPSVAYEGKFVSALSSEHCVDSLDVTVGHKSSIHSHLNYLVIVSPPFMATLANPSATVRNFARTQSSSTDVSKVTVFDLDNKFVAYSGTFEEGARTVFSQWGHIYVLTNDGKVMLEHNHISRYTN